MPKSRRTKISTSTTKKSNDSSNSSDEATSDVRATKSSISTKINLDLAESSTAQQSTSEAKILSCGIQKKENKVIGSLIDTSSKELDLNQDENETKQDKRKELTIAQKARIEVNRQKALLIRQEKLNKRKYYEKVDPKPEKQKVIKVNDTKLVDTGAGFFIEEKPNDLNKEDIIAAMHLVTDPPPLLPEDQPFCEDCSRPFDNSYLFHKFDQAVCDECREREDKHALITKTDAKNNYLLNDADFDLRPPPLKYIVRKNPHNSRWGDMKLYLKLQVEKRALEVWDSEEALDEAMDKREENREVTKKRKFMKKMKELRMNVRSSLYAKAKKFHEHDYGEEVYHSDEDEYSKTCQSCGHNYKYDKM